MNIRSQIYKEQTINYIDTGQGFPLLRDKLITELASGRNETLAQDLVDALFYGLNTDSVDKVERTFSVAQDLLQHADQHLLPAMCTDRFTQQVLKIVQPSRFIALNRSRWNSNKLHAAGLIMFWKHRSEQLKFEARCFHKSYDQLITSGAKLPSEPFVKVVINKPNAVAINNQLSGTRAYLKHVCQGGQIDTNTVRALKHHSKELLTLSQNPALILSDDQMRDCQSLYREIRTVLKRENELNHHRIEENSRKTEEQAYYAMKRPKLAKGEDLLGDKEAAPQQAVLKIHSPNKTDKNSSLLKSEKVEDEDLLSQQPKAIKTASFDNLMDIESNLKNPNDDFTEYKGSQATQMEHLMQVMTMEPISPVKSEKEMLEEVFSPTGAPKTKLPSSGSYDDLDSPDRSQSAKSNSKSDLGSFEHLGSRPHNQQQQSNPSLLQNILTGLSSLQQKALNPLTVGSSPLPDELPDGEKKTLL